MAEESSRLLENSESFRTCSVAKNKAGYTPGDEYCMGHEDTISDGDCRGRDPEGQGGEIGTNTDIQMRECLTAKNSDRYTKGNQYCAGVPDTLSDGDEKGRDPESEGGSIGTKTDIRMRECLMAKNSDRYTKGNQYCTGHEDTLADGDNRGRDPESQGSCVGTNIDINKRTASISKNLYKSGNEYCSANA